MKRFHVHVGVEKLDESIRFYSALFGAQPVKTKPDYAKWLLEDPRVNFAISTRADCAGRKRHARRLNLVNRSVGRVELARQIVEAHLAARRGDGSLLVRQTHLSGELKRSAMS